MDEIYFLLDYLIALLQSFAETVWGYFQYVMNVIINVAVTLGNNLIGLARAVWRGLHALVNLNFTSIWNTIKRGWERYQRLIDWYQRNIQEPLDRIRASIMDLYNRFFKPILHVIDQLRVMVRIIAVFNRQLAAKIDGALFGLESKLMTPITYLLKRVNELSSYTRAIITSLGLLDRVLLVETLRRDALLVWEVLTNPKARIYEPIVHPEPRPFAADVEDAHVWLRTGGGPWMEEMNDLRQSGRELIQDIGSL